MSNKLEQHLKDKNKMNLEILIHTQLIESGMIQEYIEESAQITRIIKHILEEHLKEHFKKVALKENIQKEIINNIIEDPTIEEELNDLFTDIILDFVDNNNYFLEEEDNTYISKEWMLNKTPEDFKKSRKRIKEATQNV